jgi:UDP-N-acetylmuramoyl-L-alanyl-D-glutamate--2,6-diaminopimelate ligase
VPPEPATTTEGVWDPPPPPAWQPELFTVGVTGTNGKTSTTTWVAHALARLRSPVALATTLGLFVGEEALDLPLTFESFIETMRRCRERGGAYAAIELTSESLARGFVRSWPCRVGVFTNLTHDHLDAHGTFEHYLASKAQLFVQLPAGGAAVLNGCDEAAELVAEVVPRGVRTLWYGIPSRGPARRALDVRATRVDVGWGGTQVSVEVSSALSSSTRMISTRAIGDVFAENALAAWTGAVAAGVPPDEATSAIAEAPVPPGRFELVADTPHVVVDYAHTPDALARTLRAARALSAPKGGALVVVFGAGGNRDRNKRSSMGVAAHLADRVVLTNDNPRDEDPKAIVAAIQAGLAGHRGVEVELNRELAIGRALEGCAPDDVVVIAGKGHEIEQVTKGARRALSDAEIARSWLGQKARRARSP